MVMCAASRVAKAKSDVTFSQQQNEGGLHPWPPLTISVIDVSIRGNLRSVHPAANTLLLAVLMVFLSNTSVDHRGRQCGGAAN